MKIWNPLYSVEEADKVICGFGEEADVVRKYFNKTFTYSPIHKKDLFEMKIVDLGNLSFSEFEVQFQKNPKAQYIFLGGDHSITPQLTKITKPKSLLSLDAHLDLLDTQSKQDKVVYTNTHSCAMKDVAEQGIDVAVRGYRACMPEEETYAEEKNIDTSFSLEYEKPVDYLSIDLDVLDPSFINSNTLEAFGFTPKQVCEIIRKTKPQFADIVEWKPAFGWANVVAIFKELLFL